jgi:hypothetical protein
LAPKKLEGEKGRRGERERGRRGERERGRRQGCFILL